MRRIMFSIGPLLGVGLSATAPATSLADETVALTAQEIRSFHNQVVRCWNPPRNLPASTRSNVTVRFNLDRSGMLEGEPQVTESSGHLLADRSAIRAIIRCGTDGYRLPPAKYDAWQQIILTFDLSAIVTQ